VYTSGEARLQRKSQKLSRSILGGVFSEQVALFLPDFPKDLKASEARFIGKPIDFLIFKGMDDQHISEVVFVEIKSGKFEQYALPQWCVSSVHRDTWDAG
jgi:predicted Holliday junction resolvase-like endonuclease